MSFGQTPLSNTSLGANQFPASAVAVPNTANGDFTALEGGPTSTDSNSNKTAPASIYVKDGNDVAVGVTTQAKATDGTTTSWSVIQLLKGIFDKLLGNVAVTEASAAASKADLDTIVANTTGAATAANQTTGNTSLASIKTDLDALVTNTADLLADGDQLSTIQTNTANIPAKGTAGMIGSTPVTIATNDTMLSELLTDTDSLAGSLTQQTNANTILGTTADAAVTGDTAGSLSAKLRGWSKMLFDMWDSANHWLQVKVMNANTNGQATMVNSAPVVIASNQSNLPNNLAQVGGASISLGSKTSANSVPVVVASDQAAISATIFATSDTNVGTLNFHRIALATTNATSIKASGGQVYGWVIYNAAASVRFVKLYNKASAPTVGTDTPVRTIGVQPASYAWYFNPTGISVFTLGIAMAMTTGMADSDATAVSAADLSFDLDYV